jgi:hypothetical protein
VQLERRVLRSVGLPPASDLGRYEVTLEPADRWRFKTLSLRNVGLTAPYMHDGSLAALAELVAFYDRGGVANPGLDPLARQLGLIDEAREALVAFSWSVTAAVAQDLVAHAREQAVGNVGAREGPCFRRVAPEDCSPGAPTDPDVRISRIRLLRPELRGVGRARSGRRGAEGGGIAPGAGQTRPNS